MYTVHNILPSENITNFDKEFYKIILKYADIIVHYGKSSISLLINEFPECEGVHHIVGPHGPFPYKIENNKDSRAVYNLPESKYIFLNFGRQRPYKGGDFIEKVFKVWSDNDSYLFTIGPKNIQINNRNKIVNVLKRLNHSIEKNIVSILSGLSNNKKVILRPVPDEEVPTILSAIDVFFLGHQKGINSGLLALSVSYGKPVVFPDIGNFKEQLNGWEWYESYEAGNINSAIEALSRMRRRIAQHPPGSITFNNENWLKLNSWDRHVKIITDAVESYKS